MPLKEFSAVLKISEKTIQRYKENEPLNENVSEGLIEIAEIIAMGVEVFGNKIEFLELFDKIEDTIEEVPGSRTSVNRVLVMDSAGNSVKTLRAFASQQKYHYITPLDDNQWNERKINIIGRPSRYAYGEATLQKI
ncbi:unnamed protein product [marine sediment metagenome]|uniref:Uncharacterized protein n=1 Tax=marine sediment metagenome TaxID=412755 RepID=X1BA57_9ZZZZ